jgi:PAS domain S-box-containing protein
MCWEVEPMEASEKKFDEFEELVLELDMARILFAEEEEEEEEEARIVVSIKDITERKRAEEALRESEERYRQLFEAESDAIVLIDNATGCILEANSAAAALYGYSKEELLSKKNSDLSAEPEETQRVTQTTPVDVNRVVTVPLRFHRKQDGSVFPVEITGRFLIRQGRSVHIAAIRDITERKRAEEALRRAEENFRRSLDESPLGVRIMTTEGEPLYANRAILEIYGYDSIEELRTTPVKKRYTPESYAEFQIRKKKRQQGEYDPPEYEISIVRKNGEVRHLQVFRKEVLWNGKKQYQAIYLDITERKWTEEALQESKELFEKTFVSQRDAIFLLDAINPPTILDCNPAATEVFGYTRQEMVGRTMDFLHVDETAQKEFQGYLYQTIAERGFVHLFEFQMRRKDRKVFPTEHSVIPLEDIQGNRIGWVSVVRDVTERKRADERVLTYQEQLRSLAAELSVSEERERRRIATELHDHISQTLAITKIKLGMAQKITSPSDWVGSLNEIGELIDQAIQYTRSLTFELSPPILYELGLEAAVEWLTEQIQEKHGIQIDFEDDRQPKPMNEEIRLTLFKATRELLINIVKHAQASKAKVSIWREDISIRIRVEDDGVGFSTSEDKQLGKTTEFGLFNIRERIKYLGGEIEVESEPGRGTRVTLSAPSEEKEDLN